MATRFALVFVLALLAGTAPAEADITPPWWDKVQTRNFLDPGKFAHEAGPETPGGGYRFYTTARGFRRVPLSGRLQLHKSSPLMLIAVPKAHDDAWNALVAKHDHDTDGSIYDAARSSIPGFATQILPYRSVVRPMSSPVRVVNSYFRIGDISGGTIRYTITDHRLDVDERPIVRTALVLLVISALGVTGLAFTAVRRRRTRRESA